MARKELLANTQKEVISGSHEEEFQSGSTWAGLDIEMEVEDPYFSSYSHFGIHEEMLKDEVRTESYMNAIIQNPHLFQGKIVLDIGCGTGILSIFAAQAGATHVYGIDAADVADQAHEIVRDNGYSQIVTIIKGKVEDIELPVSKVDIIISEWMGYFLLYESMLDTVIYARNKWLKPDGLMFPDKAKLFIAGIEDADYKEKKVNFWDDVYGIDMGIIKPNVMAEPIVDVVEAEALVTTDSCIFTMDLKNVRENEYEIASKYRLTATRQDYVHGIVAWFDVEFNHGRERITISTSPHRSYTHWKQTVFYLNDVLPIMVGEEIIGSLAIRKNPEHKRDLDVKISYHFDGTKHTYHDYRYYKIK